jgi:endonuclease/exonuclease/phosphatase family metal-dependent hydrolase
LAYENHRLPEGTEPRTTLAARIRPGPEAPPIVFAGIHLYETAAQRRAQAQRVVEVFRDARAPVLLVGDFNSTPDDPVMQLLAAHWEFPAKPDGGNLTFPADQPRVEIDYILIRPAPAFRVLEYRVIDERMASDHRPVFMVIELVLEGGTR